ncbi:MAG: tetratricopeptide repeat protein [Candidatus Omnitrophica bacterium]|nr:tetratricopeptide repeat protein [Candidatus Omnitrophota bacterium]
MLTFIKKTYKILLVFILVGLFFVIYNTYLVDRSVVNLKVALDRAAEARTIEDFEKIRPLLKVVILKEISKRMLSGETLMSMEMAENLTTDAKSKKQVDDVKFYLESVVNEKTKERGPFLSFLDAFFARIFRPLIEISKSELKGKERDISGKLGSIKDPKTLQAAYYELGNIYVELSDIAKAEAAFNKAIEIDVQSPIAVRSKFNLAWAYKSAQKYDEAISTFKDLIEKYPESELATVSEYQVADTFYKKGEYKKARDAYVSLVERHPKSAIADLALAQAGYISYYNLNDMESALKYFSMLEVNFQVAPITRHAKMKIRRAMSENLRIEGYKLLTEKRFEDAIATFEKAIEIAPMDSSSLSGMGLGYYELKKDMDALDKAVRATKASFELKYDEIGLTNSLYIYLHTGKDQEAIEIGERVVKARKQISLPEFYYNLGHAYLVRKRWGKAIRQFNKVIKINPDFAYAYNSLGYIFWAKGNYPAAIRKFKEAAAKNPDYMEPHFNMGLAYYYLNQLEDAYGEFKKALELDPANRRAKFYMDMITKTLGYQP